MKILSALVLVCCSFQLIGQIEEFPNIPLKEVEIRRVGSEQILRIYDHPDEVISKLGIPDSREDYYYEMDEEWGEIIKYGRNHFFIEYGEFYAFDLYTSEFEVGLGGDFISVGDSIHEISSIYPNYLQYLDEDYLNLYFEVDQVIWDAGLVIEFAPQTEIISRIMRYDP